jgi:hypothetical protein
MSTERQPTRRRDIKNALNYLESLRVELEAGLTSKGFVAHSYLEPKLEWFNKEMALILKSTGEVEPEPVKSTGNVNAGQERGE